MNASPALEMPPQLAKVLGSELTAALCAFMEEEFARRDSELAAEAFRRGLACGIGDAYAAFVLDDLTGNVGRSNAKWAKEHGITRAAASRMLVRCRKNLGMAPRVPNNARAGAVPGAKALRAAKARTAGASASSADSVKSPTP